MHDLCDFNCYNFVVCFYDYKTANQATILFLFFESPNWQWELNRQNKTRKKSIYHMTA